MFSKNIVLFHLLLPTTEPVQGLEGRSLSQKSLGAQQEMLLCFVDRLCVVKYCADVSKAFFLKAVFLVMTVSENRVNRASYLNQTPSEKTQFACLSNPMLSTAHQVSCEEEEEEELILRHQFQFM